MWRSMKRNMLYSDYVPHTVCMYEFHIMTVIIDLIVLQCILIGTVVLCSWQSVYWLRNTTFVTPADRGAATTWSSHFIGCRC